MGMGNDPGVEAGLSVFFGGGSLDSVFGLAGFLGHLAQLPAATRGAGQSRHSPAQVFGDGGSP